MDSYDAWKCIAPPDQPYEECECACCEDVRTCWEHDLRAGLMVCCRCREYSPCTSTDCDSWVEQDGDLCETCEKAYQLEESKA